MDQGLVIVALQWISPWRRDPSGGGKPLTRLPLHTPDCHVRAGPSRVSHVTGEESMDRPFGVKDWVELFREIGLDDETMHRWHGRFESRAPEAHQSFLQWLGVPQDEVTRIRDHSRGEWAHLK